MSSPRRGRVSALARTARVLTLAVAALCVVARPALPHGEGHEHPEVPAPDMGLSGTVRIAKDSQFVLGVLTERARPRDLRDRLVTQAQIVPQAGHRVRIFPPNAGRVAAVPNGRLPYLGEAVRRGQTLGYMEVMLTGEALVFAQPQRTGATQQARMELRQAEQELMRMRADNAPPEQVAASSGVVEMLRERLALVQREERQIGSVGSVFTRFPIYSPIDGVIAETEVSPGDMIDTQRLLFAIVDLSGVWIEARIYEPDLPRAVAATEATVSLEAFPGEYFTATRVAATPQLDPLTRSARMMFEIPNPGNRLRPGMFARAELAGSGVRRTLAVPTSAVVTDGARSFVFVHASPEVFVKREVTVGARDGAYCEILGGLAQGERVVSRAAQQLQSLL